MEIIWARQFPDGGKPDESIFLAGPTLRSKECAECNGTGGVTWTTGEKMPCPKCVCKGLQPGKLRSWREDAIELFKEMGYTGRVYIPEPENFEGFECSINSKEDYSLQLTWETMGLTDTRAIIFWVPRDLQVLPGFTTNIEFGEWFKDPKSFVGFPEDAPKTKCLKWKIENQTDSFVSHTLKETLVRAWSWLQKCNSQSGE